MKFQTMARKLNDEELKKFMDRFIKQCAIDTFTLEILFSYFVSIPASESYRDELKKNISFACELVSEIAQETENIAQPTNTSSLASLPEAIIGKVFSFCAMPDYRSLSETCRDFVWISESPNQVRELELKLDDQLIDEYPMLFPIKNGMHATPRYRYPHIESVFLCASGKTKCDDEAIHRLYNENLFDFNQITLLKTCCFGNYHYG